MIADELQKIIETSNGEGEVSAFLKRHPLIVLQGVVRFGDGSCVVAEFPFGNEHRADFVALAPFSGGWEIHFIELEPPNERMFTKEGVMAKRLNKASSQVDSWRIFIEKNRETVLRDLARYAKDKDLIRGPRDSEPTCHVGWPLYHPKSWLHIHYDIVIGKRSDLSHRDIEAKSAFKENHNTELMTYDRFITAARRIQ